MRRPWMRRLHLMPMRRLIGDRRLKFYSSYKRQNRLARRIGLPLLKGAYVLLIGSIFLQFMYWVVQSMNEKGYLAPPQLEGRRVAD